MNCKTQRLQKQLLRRREAKQLFVAPLPEAIFAPPAFPTVPLEDAATAHRIISQEFNLFLADLNRLFLRARQRMLLVAAKEERTTQ